jgi:hypothetical protein
MNKLFSIFIIVLFYTLQFSIINCKEEFDQNNDDYTLSQTQGETNTSNI